MMFWHLSRWSQCLITRLEPADLGQRLVPWPGPLGPRSPGAEAGKTKEVFLSATRLGHIRRAAESRAAGRDQLVVK